MGEKYPAIDFFVELLGATTSQTPYFLVQVKSTSGGYTQAGRLRARVTPSGMNGLVKYPAPTYLIGVDEEREVGFVVAAVVGGVSQYRSLPTTFSLDLASTLRFLHEEVEAFWDSRNVRFRDSRFL